MLADGFVSDSAFGFAKSLSFAPNWPRMHLVTGIHAPECRLSPNAMKLT